MVVCLIIFAWLGIKVHDELDGLRQIGVQVVASGGAVRSGFSSAASAVSGVPLAGGQLAQGLRQAGADASGPVVDAGRGAEHSVDSAATALGWVVFLVPALILLAFYAPSRARQARTLSAAARVLRPAAEEGLRRELAERAAYSLPYGQLLRHSRDPLGDLAAGRYEPLIEALLENPAV